MKRFALASSLLLFALPAGAEYRPHAVAWRVPLPEVGQSDVCIQGDHLFITSFAPLPVYSDKQRRAARGKGISAVPNLVGQCFDRHSGKLLWEVPMNPGHDVGPVGILGMWGGATVLNPIATEDHVVFYNKYGVLLGCDRQGREVWRRTFGTPDKLQKSMRMFLHGGRLITALPARGSSNRRPTYELHAIDLADGRDIWVAETQQGMASHYAPARWKGRDVMLSSRMDRSHANFPGPNIGFAVSLDDGTTLAEIELPDGTAPQLAPMCDGKHMILLNRIRETVGDATETTRFVEYFGLADGESKRRVKLGTPAQVHYYEYGPEGYRKAPYVPAFADKGKPYNLDNAPMAASLRIFEGKAFYLTYSGNALGCLDLETGRNLIVDLPLQVRDNEAIWDRRQVKLFGGIRNTAGTLIRDEKFGNGRSRTTPSMGGFGHGITRPVRHGDTLYWQGALGVIYMIDLSGAFTPEKVSWTALSQTELHWCQGALAVDDEGIYARSHKSLFRIAHPE